MPTTANMAKVNGIVISGAPAASDAHVLIATATASSSATLSFTLGLDSLYDVYEFRFDNMHPATNDIYYTFQVNADGQTGFNETITSTSFYTLHNEADSSTALSYHASYDQAQGTAYQTIAIGGGNGADESTSGILTLYDPSSTTYVKHFVAQGNAYHHANGTITTHAAGYINTTSAIDEISFKFSSGNTDAGVIKMYGIATS